jgi:hypothetical protein
VRRLTVLACLAATLAPRVAAAGISLAMEPAGPGSPDVVVRWVADPTSPAPHALLRRRVAFAAGAVAAALPLDPVADVLAPDLAGDRVRLAGEADPSLGPGVGVYQVVDAAGQCSNVGYVVVRPRLSPGPGGVPVAALGLPGRHAYGTARRVLDALPGLHRVEMIDPETCRRTFLARKPDGSTWGRNFLVPPRAVVWIAAAEAVTPVVVGASAPGDADRVVSSSDAPACERAVDVCIPLGSAVDSVHDVLCGREGVDWVDADGDGYPDACPAGLAYPLAWVTTLVTVGAVGDGFPDLQRDCWLAGDGLRCSPPNADMMPSGAVHVGWPYGHPALVELRPGDEGDTEPCRCTADTDGDGEDDCTELLQGSDPGDAASAGADTDGDGVRDAVDTCPAEPDALQPDADGDGRGDACDPCPVDAADA